MKRAVRPAPNARALLAGGKRDQAERLLADSASSASMRSALTFMVAEQGKPGADDRIAKTLADFDLQALRRLKRSRILVRAGPGLGLMGTLIPLSPALSALGRGDLEQLSDALRVAFGQRSSHPGDARPDGVSVLERSTACGTAS